MSKRPTPKKRKAKSSGRAQHSQFQLQELRRLRNRANSPFSVRATAKRGGDKALKSITKIKA
ncbi:hypothetical protein FJZ28_03900 [Candidatus Peregrinibacteria bacterium]|nr:hypothetical protein [Candidatus Peregrinibacteria bacterium]